MNAVNGTTADGDVAGGTDCALTHKTGKSVVTTRRRHSAFINCGVLCARRVQPDAVAVGRNVEERNPKNKGACYRLNNNAVYRRALCVNAEVSDRNISRLNVDNSARGRPSDDGIRAGRREFCR